MRILNTGSESRANVPGVISHLHVAFEELSETLERQTYTQWVWQSLLRTVES